MCSYKLFNYLIINVLFVLSCPIFGQVDYSFLHFSDETVQNLSNLAQEREADFQFTEKPMFAPRQSKGTYLRFRTNTCSQDQIIQFLQGDPTLRQVKQRFGDEIQDWVLDVPVYISKRKPPSGKWRVLRSYGMLARDPSFEWSSSASETQCVGTWAISKTGNTIDALYLEQPFSTPVLSKSMAKCLSFFQHMNNPDVPIFLKSVTRYRGDSEPSQMDYFMAALKIPQSSLYFEPPIYKMKDYFPKWERAIMKMTLEQLNEDKDLMGRYQSVLKLALDGNSYYNFFLEDLTDMMGQKEDALTLMRNRYFRTMCGNDTSMTRHLFRITKVAAETGNLDVFFKAFFKVLPQIDNLAPDPEVKPFEIMSPSDLFKDLHIQNAGEFLIGSFAMVNGASIMHESWEIFLSNPLLFELLGHDEMEKVVKTLYLEKDLDALNRMQLFYLWMSSLGIHFQKQNPVLLMELEQVQQFMVEEKGLSDKSIECFMLRNLREEIEKEL